MQFRCLGPLGVSEAAQDRPLGGPKQRLVLAHLLIRANQTVPVDRLIAAVWDDNPPPAARSTLQGYVSHLRKVLGADRIVGDGQGYTLQVDRDAVDRMQFDHLVSEGRRLRSDDPTAAGDTLREALALWHGPPFADLSDAASLQPEITRLEELRLTAIEDRIAADLDAKRDRDLVGELEALTAEHPLRELLWAQLMHALYRSGRQADALAAFDRARRLLADELGIDPSPELRAFHGRVLRQDPSLRSAAPTLKGYRLVEQIGEGAFGVVWRATQPGTDRDVAIKAARPALANDPEFIRRFDADAQRIARIEHPHVVPLYDFWREPDGAYLVLRYMRGGSLRDRLSTSDPLDHGDALRIADQIAQALATAHQIDVVHGDVTASNVLFDGQGNAYLTDFILGRQRGAHVDAGARHDTPERTDDHSSGVRSDVHALGMVLRELLPDADGAVAEVIRRATTRDAAARQPDGGQLRAELRAAVSGTLHPLPVGAAGTAADGSAAHGALAVRNPYKGLRAFTEGDAADFFGRDTVVARLLSRLRDSGAAGRFLAVVGPSGSGKSSVVRAGLVPALRAGALDGSRDWYVVQMVPGSRPYDELATALRHVAIDPPDDLADRLRDGGMAVIPSLLADDGELLLVIDQFEELFTLVKDADVYQRFIDCLVDAVTAADSHVRAVLTLRADFYDRPLQHAGLGALMQARTETLLPLTATELERAVTGPAEQVGVAVERPLVAHMVADVADQPGALPLLQYALTELFDGRDDHVMSDAAYRAVGGLAGALSRRAEAVHASLTEAGREAARQLFLRLVTPGEGVEDTRRRAMVAEVTALAPDAMPDVLQLFGDARLLSFDRDPDTRAPTVEVAHEALLREWRRLRGWIDAARDDLRTHRRLQAAAADWATADRDPSFLATGSQLAQYEAWREGSGLTTTAAEVEYLDASVEHGDHALAEEAARRQRELDLERRSVRRLRVLVAVLGIAALVAGGLTIFAINQAHRAAEETVRAERGERTAVARELAAAVAANLDVDPERSMLLAIEAINTTRDTDGLVLREAEEALHHAVGASRIVLRVPSLGGALDWSPTGVFVTEGPEDSGVIDIRDAATGVSVSRWRGHDIDINDVEFSDDGGLLATTGDDGALRVWDTASGKLVAETVDAGVKVWSPSFSADGSLVAAYSEDGRWVKVMNVANGRIVTTVTLEHSPWAVATSPEGGEIAIASDATSDIAVFDVRSGSEVRVLRGGESTPWAVAWSPDGRRIAATNNDGTARVWDARTGTLESTLFGHSGGATDIAWARDSSHVVTGSYDGTTKVWRVTGQGAQQLHSLSSSDTTDGAYGVAFSPDGRQVMTGDAEVGAVTIWDISTSGDAEWMSLAADFGSFTPVVFVGDDRLASSDTDGVVTVHDTADGSKVLTIDDHAAHATVIESLDASPDGGLIAGAVNVDEELLASAEPDPLDREVTYAATVWDARTGEPRFTVHHDAAVSDVAVRRDHMASSDSSGVVKIAHGSADRVDVLQEEPGYEITAIDLSPNGRLLAVSGVDERESDRRIRIWDVLRGEVIETLPTGATDLAFTRDGTRLIAAEYVDPRATVWDVTSWDIVSVFQGHSGQVLALDVAADSSTVTTAGTNGTILLWNASTGRERLALTGHERAVTTLALSPDGTRLASGGQDGVVRIWALELDDLIAIARSELTRDLTDAECRQYLHLNACP